MKPRKPKVSVRENSNSSITNRFPIVAIGTSAGGLEALEQFLGNVPENSEMAYVVIQHLDPTQKGMLPELLQRISKMDVFQVKDRMVVKPNCVYVIPPNKSMSILRGMLHLFEPIEVRGLRLPIDFFFRSLADDCKELGVGIILSGMGSDGSAGLRAIKEKNGIVLVQDPSTAKYDSMPRNAIDSVLVDIIASAKEMPAKLLDFLKHIPIVISNLEKEIKDQSALEKIIIILRTQTGNDFSLYKKNTIYRRIERRMSVHKIDKISTYVRFLQENSKEVDILFKELLIGVTNFFRDPSVWEKLKDTILPNILLNLKNGSVLRAWIPGCSTGEEAYSLAMLFKEAIEKKDASTGITLQIFASDIDNEAIEICRKGVYNANISADVTPNRLARFFTEVEDGFRVNTEIREMIVFAQHNIILHPPFTKIDILTCRNLMIYLEPELQKKLLGLFYYSINPEGIMVLGSSETLGSQSHLFTTVDSKLKIYKRSLSALMPESFDFPSSYTRTKLQNTEIPNTAKSILSLQVLADQLLLQHFSPPGVLVNDKGDIIYTSGRTGKYLEPAVGKANLNIFAMLREGLRNEFPVAFRKARTTEGTAFLHNIKVGTNGGTQIVNVTIRWIDKPEPLKGMIMIIFVDAPEIMAINENVPKEKKHVSGARQIELENELQHTREEMQNTVEEMQTSQEELKSANEELQSTNEELQSTNEELTTSKEEMQSLNEELQTVNAELQSKVEDFSRVNNDMKNLLNSTDIATLFLDKQLNIRRFTNQATKIFKLIKSDIGRPFTDLASDLDYPDLATDAREVLRTLIFVQKQISTRDGRWFSIRIMPYRTFDDRIDGLVITFINTSDIKQLESELHKREQMFHLLFKASSDIIINLSTSGQILGFNPEAENFFNKTQKEVVDQNFIQLFVPEPVRKTVEKDFKEMLNEDCIVNYKMQVLANGGSPTDIECSVSILQNNLNIPTEMVIITKNKPDNE